MDCELLETSRYRLQGNSLNTDVEASGSILHILQVVLQLRILILQCKQLVAMVIQFLFWCILNLLKRLYSP
ncbi:hypothetical protein NDU88_001244, partial [Pleurodeles waltl]